ncbi:MAG: thioredoxin family protein [Verrucomicrobia bacterium]|jgi:thiol-disulfide isomerase/thioredoxin|nr:thioredoxin family protein [Verrucomicrobiota bacterium]MBT7069123.1 thioredoxin family protein [Verrucomicrobiota bacterium]MBT7699459.1 thioredoxin family protein [Verrucomicrobiota bacterium]
MGILFLVLTIFGWVTLIAGGIMLIVAAFRVSVVWGICVLFLGPAGLVFLIMHWEEAKKPFGVQILGLLLFGASMFQAMARGAPLMEPMLQKMVDSGLPEQQLAMLEKMAPDMVPLPTPAAAKKAKPAEPVRVKGKDPKDFEGASLAEVREILGRPRGEMKSGGEICFLYDRFTLFSADGETVSHVEVEGGAPSGGSKKPKRRAVAPTGASGSDTVPEVRKIANGGQRVDLKKIVVPGKITVVDFYADWCGPCRRMGPELEKIARTDPDVKLVKIDVVNWNTDVIKQFGIRSIPNVHVYDRNGTAVGAPTAGLTAVKQNIGRAR